MDEKVAKGGKAKTSLDIIAENIRKFRESQKMTQKEVGLLLGFNEDYAQQRISQYETGKRSPNKKTLEKLSLIFNRPISDFFTDKPL